MEKWQRAQPALALDAHRKANSPGTETPPRCISCEVQGTWVSVTAAMKTGGGQVRCW